MSLNSQVVFEGVAGTGYMGDIAIDDVMVYKTKDCALKPALATPRPPQPTPVPTPPRKLRLEQINNNTNHTEGLFQALHFVIRHISFLARYQLREGNFVWFHFPFL